MTILDRIRFLSVQDVLDIHRNTLQHEGGASGVRDIGLLESAVATPHQSFGGQPLHQDLAAMAAAYLFHIAQNHPFVDGNKRTGLQACQVFLAVNGRRPRFSADALYQVTLDVARGAVDKTELTVWLRAELAR